MQINASAVGICHGTQITPDSNPERLEMTITPKEKELAAVGISVAAGCKPCTDHHVGVARKARASDPEIEEAVVAALAVRKSATDIMASYALAKLGDLEHRGDGSSSAETSRQRALVAVGAAFAVNCVSSLEAHLEAADAVGITHEEINQIVKLAAFIKERAASHVERLVGLSEAPAA
jgi:AhpD family alkylhydroperoxidase